MSHAKKIMGELRNEKRAESGKLKTSSNKLT